MPSDDDILNEIHQYSVAQDAAHIGLTRGMAALSAGIQSITKPIKAPFQFAGSLLGDVGKTIMGTPTVPGATFIGGQREQMADSRQMAEDAYNKGNYGQAALHELAGVIPMLGPVAEQGWQKIQRGAQAGDRGMIGDGVSDFASFLSPETLKLLPKMPKVGEALTKSAGENYYRTVTPIKPEDMVPQAKSVAQQLANGPAPVAMTREGLINKMEEGKRTEGPKADEALNYAVTGREGPLKPLMDMLDKYAVDKYTNPKVGGGRVPRSIVGLQAVKELQDEIVNGAGGNQQPGITPAGQTPPRQPVSSVALQTINNIRRDLETGTVDKNGNWRENIDPNSVDKMDRNHAKVIRDYLDTTAPDIAEINKSYRMYSAAKNFMQQAYNTREATGKAAIPIVGSIRRGEMPQAIQNSFLNVPWNTVAGATKSALATAIAKGDWNTATRTLQFARLGIPVSDNSSLKPIEEGGTRMQ